MCKDIYPKEGKGLSIKPIRIQLIPLAIPLCLLLAAGAHAQRIPVVESPAILQPRLNPGILVPVATSSAAAASSVASPTPSSQGSAQTNPGLAAPVNGGAVASSSAAFSQGATVGTPGASTSSQPSPNDPVSSQSSSVISSVPRSSAEGKSSASSIAQPPPAGSTGGNQSTSDPPRSSSHSSSVGRSSSQQSSAASKRSEASSSTSHASSASSEAAIIPSDFSAQIIPGRSATSSASSSSEVLVPVRTEDSPILLRPLFARENFGYNVPLVPEEHVMTPFTVSRDPSVFFINFLLALLTTLLLGNASWLLGGISSSIPPGVKMFLRRLPLSLALFLLLMAVHAFLFPTAFAQGEAASVSFSGMILPLYGVLFFFVAGITNFICNNVIAAEAATLERAFLPVRATGADVPSWKRTRGVILCFFLLYAMIGAHINTSFSLLPTTQPGMAMIAFLTILFAAYAKDGFRYLLAGRFHWQRLLEANALGILLALFSIWLTRSLGLTPGYLFGIPVGVFIFSSTYNQREGIFEWMGLLAMLVAAFVAWLIVPFTSGAPVIGDFLRLLLIILIEACFFESLPFQYLAGNSLYRWKKWAWALQCTLATFLVLHLLWNPGSTIGTLKVSPPALTYLMLLGMYVVAVIVLVLYCKMRRRA